MSTTLYAGNSCTLQLTFKNQPILHVFTLASPTRLVVDYKQTQLITDYTHQPPPACVQAVRFNKNHNGYKRVVYDIAYPITLKQSLKYTKTGYRLDVLLNASTHQNSKKIETQTITTETTHTPIRPWRDMEVVIDPGHGGNDPGAIAKNGTKEKNISLAIAKKIMLILNKEKGIHASLTRKTDTYVSLRNRLDFAKKADADLFIAIHADAHSSTKAKGMSVYALSERGATSEAARILAVKENIQDKSSAQTDNHNYILESVLIDLEQVATVHQSLSFGKLVLKNLKNIALLHRKQVEQAAFVVLKSPNIPSLLIETGFLSNEQEANALASSAYQTKIAENLTQSIVAYFSEKTPANSWFYVNKNYRCYTVQKGDTMSAIANKFHIVTSSLQQFNHKENLKLAIGERLYLPQ